MSMRHENGYRHEHDNEHEHEHEHCNDIGLSYWTLVLFMS